MEQIPDRRIAWESIQGATNNGTVEFQEAGADRTIIALTLEYKPEGMVEKVGDLLHVVARQAKHDLKQFKHFIENEVFAGHVFDQTNGLVDFHGESKETAEGGGGSPAL